MFKKTKLLPRLIFFIAFGVMGRVPRMSQCMALYEHLWAQYLTQGYLGNAVPSRLKCNVSILQGTSLLNQP